ncbi:MAG: methylenetetrahydrofolate reductase [Bacteroidales bacterium]|nr:methylenetetrahydrofolate reductase [Candidatus Cacconaster merdequi]
MKVSDILLQSGKTFPSLEFVPPLKGSDLEILYQTMDPLMEFNPPYINITCHRDEIVDGRAVTRHPSTTAVTAALLRRYRTEVVPHIICGGASRYRIEDELFDLNFIGVENVMALRGEPAKGEDQFTAVKDGHSHCSELVAQIEETFPGKFCIGVAGYPEKHREAESIDSDIAFLRQKVDEGAGYIITQMFFDNRLYYDFVGKCRAAGITVPIVPGLKPIANKGHLEKLPAAFSLKLPEELVGEINRCTDDKQVYSLGVEWCIEQSRDLVRNGVPAIHYYTMSRGRNVAEIIRNVF